MQVHAPLHSWIIPLPLVVPPVWNWRAGPGWFHILHSVPLTRILDYHFLNRDHVSSIVITTPPKCSVSLSSAFLLSKSRTKASESSQHCDTVPYPIKHSGWWVMHVSCAYLPRCPPYLEEQVLTSIQTGAFPTASVPSCFPHCKHLFICLFVFIWKADI